MGYSYGRGPSGRWVLACDLCSRADGTARKVRCPYGYCPATALCRSCRAGPIPGDFFSRNPELAPFSGERWASRALHRGMGCQRKHLEYIAAQERERALVVRGAYLRRSAMSTGVRDPVTGETVVQVVFSRSWGELGPERWALMRQSTYRAVPFGFPAQAEDYRAFGAVVAGPIGFVGHGATTDPDVARAWSEARPIESAESYGSESYKAALVHVVAPGAGEPVEGGGA